MTVQNIRLHLYLAAFVHGGGDSALYFFDREEAHGLLTPSNPHFPTFKIYAVLNTCTFFF